MIMVIIITIIVVVTRPHKTLCVTHNTHHNMAAHPEDHKRKNRRKNGRSLPHGSTGGLVRRFLGEGDESAGGGGVGGEAQGAARDDGSKPPAVLSNVVQDSIGIVGRKDAFRRPSTSEMVDTIGPL
jgi:hypothetical protein